MSMSVNGVGGGAGASIVSGASSRLPPQQKMANLYNQIDSAGTGSITQAQFTQAFNAMNPPSVFKNAGASTVYNHLDPNGTGSVSRTDFINGMKSLMVSLRSGSSGG